MESELRGRHFDADDDIIADVGTFLRSKKGIVSSWSAPPARSALHMYKQSTILDCKIEQLHLDKLNNFC